MKNNPMIRNYNFANFSCYFFIILTFLTGPTYGDSENFLYELLQKNNVLGDKDRNKILDIIPKGSIEKELEESSRIEIRDGGNSCQLRTLNLSFLIDSFQEEQKREDLNLIENKRKIQMSLLAGLLLQSKDHRELKEKLTLFNLMNSKSSLSKRKLLKIRSFLKRIFYQPLEKRFNIVFSWKGGRPTPNKPISKIISDIFHTTFPMIFLEIIPSMPSHEQAIKGHLYPRNISRYCYENIKKMWVKCTDFRKNKKSGIFIQYGTSSKHTRLNFQPTLDKSFDPVALLIETSKQFESNTQLESSSGLILSHVYWSKEKKSRNSFNIESKDIEESKELIKNNFFLGPNTHTTLSVEPSSTLHLNSFITKRKLIIIGRNNLYYTLDLLYTNDDESRPNLHYSCFNINGSILKKHQMKRRFYELEKEEFLLLQKEMKEVSDEVMDGWEEELSFHLKSALPFVHLGDCPLSIGHKKTLEEMGVNLSFLQEWQILLKKASKNKSYGLIFDQMENAVGPLRLKPYLEMDFRLKVCSVPL